MILSFRHLLSLGLLAGSVSIVSAGDRMTIAEDEASHGAYNGGWNAGQVSGSGFGPWEFRSAIGSETESFAGIFVAHAGVQPDMDGVARNGKAFGLFANGVDFETAVAFRPFNQPMEPSDAFSFIMEVNHFLPKFERDDPRLGSIGLALRSETSSETWDEYDVGARFQFGFFQGEENYQVLDGEDSSNTGIPVEPNGVSVSVHLLTPDTYDLEITQLSTGQTTVLPNRRLGGDAGAPLMSFVIFNLDGETGDAYFNGFQISRPAGADGR
jgi:hypothetical protein